LRNHPSLPESSPNLLLTLPSDINTALFPNPIRENLKNKPPNDLICIQIINQNFWWACNFEVFKGSGNACI
jgi:SET domain-containing protein